MQDQSRGQCLFEKEKEEVGPREGNAIKARGGSMKGKNEIKRTQSELVTQWNQCSLIFN